MKKMISVLTIAGLLSSGAQAVFAEGASTASPGGSAAGNGIELRQAAEWVGASVKWDAAKRAAVVKYGAIEWVIQVGQSQSLLNGQSYALQSTAMTNAAHHLQVSIEDVNKALQVQLSVGEQGEIVIDQADLKSQATHLLKQIIAGQFDVVHASMSEGLQGALPVPALQMLQQQLLVMYGKLDNVQQVTLTTNAVHQNVRVTYTGPQGAPAAVDVRFDLKGKLDDFFFPPSLINNYQAPSYDHPDRYKVEEVKIGEGNAALPGALTIPQGNGPFPVVVLVHGSGPNDRDESIGGSKFFRDVAVGLANEGVAVLRYDKRTFEHMFKSQSPSFTVKEETNDDAIAAVQLLSRDKRFDPKQIYVLGHSQGAMLVPRIIAQDAKHQIAGAMVFAGPSKPLEDILLWQFQQGVERAKKGGAPKEVLAQLEAQLHVWEQSMALLKDPKYAVTNLPKEFPAGQAAWWFDLRNYRGQEVAKSQNVPLFIAQGDNDIQVEPSNLDGWKSGLTARTNVTYKLYPKLNHVFVSYDKPSTGQEYFLPGNTPQEVITDIAKWMKGSK